MRALVIAVVLLTPILAGCLATDDGAPSAGSEPAAVPEPWTIPFSVTDCTMVWASLTFDIERARAFLPPGYEPHEGGNLVGANSGETLPAPVAGLNLVSMQCPHHELANGTAAWVHAAIDIQPPKVANATSPSPHDIYDVLYATDEQGVLDTFQRAGLPVVDAEIVQDVTLAGSAATGAVRVIDGDGGLLRLEVAGSGPVLVEGTAALWHQSEEGVSLTHWDGRPGTRFWGGPVAVCELRAGSVLAELVGATDCRVRANAGFVGADYGIDQTLTFMPGVAAEVGG